MTINEERAIDKNNWTSKLLLYRWSKCPTISDECHVSGDNSCISIATMQKHTFATGQRNRWSYKCVVGSLFTCKFSLLWYSYFRIIHSPFWRDIKWLSDLKLQIQYYFLRRLKLIFFKCVHRPLHSFKLFTNCLSRTLWQTNDDDNMWAKMIKSQR